ncbi:TonB-dependent receptor [Arachidicoccus ginsenosidivorans]
MIIMRKLFYILIGGLIGLPLQHGFAQSVKSVHPSITKPKDTLQVSGVILDVVSKRPLYGVYVSYKDYGAAITDSLGHFSIAVPNMQITLMVKAEDYNNQQVALKGRSSIEILLQKSGAASFYNEIVTPSRQVSRSKITGAMDAIETKGNWNADPGSVDNFLQGKVSGLNVIRRSGTPAAGANLYLRGYNSLYASNQPIIIVDGVYYDNATYGASLNKGYYNNPLSFIDLKDIDKITVIKDATSTYGSKGANGAIIITTARAHEEATSIDVLLSGGVNFSPKSLPVMDASDFRSYLSEMLQSKGMTDADISALSYMNDSTSSMDYYNVHQNNNWQNKIFRNSYMQNAYLKIAGGDNIAKYALSIGYGNNKSPLQNTGLTRYNMRFNADLNLTKRLIASANVSYYRNEQNIRNTGIAPTTNPIFTSLVKAPFFADHLISASGVVSPQYADHDTLGISNPIAIINSEKGQNNSFRYNGGISFKYLLSKNLSLATTVSITSQKIRETFFVPQRGIVSDTLMNDLLANNRSGAQVIKLFNVYNDSRINYNQHFGFINDLDVTFGFRYNKLKSEQDYGLGFNAATDQLTSVGYGLNTLRQIGGSIGSSTWMETYLNAAYGLQDKYFLNVNASMDASSKFGRNVNSGALRIADRPFGVFPSAGFSWLASSEKFMANANWLDLLKFRVSYGMMGNDDIGNYTARSYYTAQNLLGISGLVKGNLGNESLMWERVSKANIGLDVDLLNNRLSLTLDAYHNKTSHMVIYEPGPTVSGQDYIITNNGGMKTSGGEISLNAVLVNKRRFNWQLGFNIAKYTSIITKLPTGPIYTDFADGVILTSIDNAPNLFFGYKTNGVYSSDQEATAAGLSKLNSNGTTSIFHGGDVRFVDLNGDKVIDEQDRQVIGNPNPDFYGGANTAITFSNWTLSALVTFMKGNDLYNYARRQLESENNFYNQTAAIKNRWRTDGQITAIPKATWADPMGNSRFSDRWIEDGSYIRLKNLSLSYNIPLKANKALKSMNVFLTGTNLLTLTKYLGYDPEFSATSSVFGQGVDTFLEPQYKSIELGVKVGL